MTGKNNKRPIEETLATVIVLLAIAVGFILAQYHPTL